MVKTDLSDAERLQPALLDRLTDLEPTKKKETARNQVIDIRRLREIIQRDLTWLMNTVNNDSWIDADIYPHAARSTLNFGIADVAGKRSTLSGGLDLEAAVHRAITDFEPRIIAGTLEVRVAESDEISTSVISFDIRGELWAMPVPMELYLRTEFNVADGEISVTRQM
jgi:type VI secretion system protein ImpF